LGERVEDAIHPFALQLAVHMHADGIAGVIHLRLHRGTNESRRKRKDRKHELDHANLQLTGQVQTSLYAVGAIHSRASLIPTRLSKLRLMRREVDEVLLKDACQITRSKS